MRDDDAAEVPTKGARTPDAHPLRDAAVLPEHASAYYSPRPPPATTAHDTIETEPVRLDPAIDPGVAFSERITEDDLDPPRKMDPRADAEAPTVLVPIVRARRRRRRGFAIATATLVGALAGIGFGLMPASTVPGSAGTSNGSTVTTPVRPSTPVPATVARGAALPKSAPSATTDAPISGLAETGASTGPIASSPVAHGHRSLPVAQRRESSASAAWFKAEPPKAWIK